MLQVQRYHLKKPNANEPGNLKTQITPDNCVLLESLFSRVAVK